MSGGGFFRSTSIVGAATLLSRVTGLLRDMVYSRMFGAGVLMDAFLVAFKIPNFMRRLFAEGAFSQAFVPILAEYRRTRGDDATRDQLLRQAEQLYEEIGAPLHAARLAARRLEGSA